jgi:drug/metabolite transporter (DMT)-like permease
MFQLLPTLMLLPLVIYRTRSILKGGWSLALGGALAGISLVLYSGALIYTDVVRALLLFYLTPLWSTLLARFSQGEPITRLRLVTIILALFGLGLIIRIETSFEIQMNVGDWMGLASGIIWAFAAVKIKASGPGKGVNFALSYFVLGSVAALALTLLPLEGAGDPPSLTALIAVLYWMIPVALFLILPPAFALMWGASVISPGLIGILFMTEVSVGAVTAAIWAGEPFGLREALGVIVITTAGALEPVTSLIRSRQRGS